MDLSDKDGDTSVNYDSVINNNTNPSAEWPISGSNQMMETLWYDPTHVQAVGPSSFRGNLEMGWNASGFLPPSMAQFPADSAFIERAARFSLFSDMVNLGNPHLFPMQGHSPSNQLNAAEAHNDASSTLKDPHVRSTVPASEDTHSSGANGQKRRETFDSRKRKRNGQISEAGQSQRSQQSEEQEPDKNGDQKRNDDQSPNSTENKTSSGKQTTSDPPKDGYIHVRARRGQATNSHSLAERVRREKISERMKFLQDLVPGCNKVTGKAVMLDEIINYVQSLQRQVEFLSMKLATVNPQIDFNLESLIAKDTLQLRAGSSSATPFAQTMPMVYPPLPHGFMQQTLSNIGRTTSSPLSPMNGGFKRQETNGWEGDLQNVIHINYGAGDVPPNPQEAATAALPAPNMKVEP